MLKIKMAVVFVIYLLLFTACGLTTDHALDSHAKQEVTFKNCSSVVTGSITPEPGTSTIAVDYGDPGTPDDFPVKMLLVPDDVLNLDTGEFYDNNGTFVAQGPIIGPKGFSATMSNGNRLFSYWPGPPTARADITFTHLADWHGQDKNTIQVFGANLSRVNINQFTTLAYFAAKAKGLTPASFAAAIDETGKFFNSKFPSYGLGVPVNFATDPLTDPFLRLNNTIHIQANDDFFIITGLDTPCYGPPANFSVCPNTFPNTAYELAMNVSQAKQISFMEAKELVKQKLGSILGEPGDWYFQLYNFYGQGILAKYTINSSTASFTITEIASSITACKGATKDFPACQ